jgi:hypothetical protein
LAATPICGKPLSEDLWAMRKSLPKRDQLLLRVSAAKKEAGRAFAFVKIQIPKTDEEAQKQMAPDAETFARTNAVRIGTWGAIPFGRPPCFSAALDGLREARALRRSNYCLITVPSIRRISPHPPFRPLAGLVNGALAAAFSSTSMPQPGFSLTQR